MSTTLRRRLAPLAAAVAVALAALPTPVAQGDARAAVAQPAQQQIAPAAGIVAPYASAGREPVAPGVDHDWGGLTTTSGKQAIHYVEVTPGDPAVFFESSLSNERGQGLERTSAMAARNSAEGHRVIAAINGDVWGVSSPSMYAPNGLHVQNGELMVATRVGKATFGVRADNSPFLGAPGLIASLTDTAGRVTQVARLNQWRRTGELVLYTSRFGGSTLTNTSGTEVVLNAVPTALPPSSAFTGTVAAVRKSRGNTSLAPGRMVLSGSGAGATALNRLAVGQVVTLNVGVTPGWETVRQAIGGREWIIQNGAIDIFPRPDSADVSHPRSVIAQKADGKVILATIDGRRPGYSVGMTLPDVGRFLLGLGAVWAMNLDGGGSTVMLVRRKGDVNASIINRPSDGSERLVANALLLVSTTPTGPLAAADIQPGDPTLYEGTTLGFAVKGHDTAYNGVPIGEGSVQWSLAGANGQLDTAGRFTATTQGSSVVTAVVGPVSDTSTVTVVPDTAAPVVAAPSHAFVNGASVSTSGTSLMVSWSGSDEGRGIAAYEVQRSVNGAAYEPVPIPGPGATSTRFSVEPGRTYRFQARATDLAGNVGAWTAGPAFMLDLLQENSSSVTYSGTWSNQASGSYLGGAVRYTKTAGRRAKLSFTGSHVAWISTKAPSRGAARFYVDGRLSTTYSTYQASTSYRKIITSRAWPGPGSHSVEIRVSGTSGHPRVDLDAFAILKPPAPDPVLVGAGDIASCSLTGDTATAKLVKSIKGFVFTTGDNAYNRGTPTQFANCYGPTWGAFKSRTRPTPGNHEYMTAGAAGYFGYFGSRAGTAGQGWYVYQLGAWRIYALNANCAAVGCGPGSAQEAWLRADLAANPRTCVLAYWHQPLFSSGVHGNDESVRPLWDALYEARADVVLNGHDHDYERFAPQSPDGEPDPSGIRQFVVGTGGSALTGFSAIKPNSEVRSSSAHGVLKLTLRPTSYAWSFVPVAGKTFKDSGSTACN